MFLEPEKCYYLTYTRHSEIIGCFLFFFWSWKFALYFYGPRIREYTFPVFCTFVIAWLIARCCDGAILYSPVDTLTVHLLVWQCVSLMCSWQMHELPWFSLRLHQGSTCVLLALDAFYVYELCMRYVSVRYRLCFAWFVSICDM